MSEVLFRCEGVGRRYGETPVLHDCTFSLSAGSFTVLIGPSGCGKTTLLEIIAGLQPHEEGTLWLNGQRVDTQDAQKIAVVFQDPILLEHMSVQENIAFGAPDRPCGDTAAKVEEIADLLSLSPLLERRCDQLSGGEKQRVAIGRALMKEADLILMDEPFSALDALLKQRLGDRLSELQKRLQLTILYVTHDQREALRLADHLIVMNEGIIQQQGTPREIYEHPRNLFVAGFIGHPPMNLVEARLEEKKLCFFDVALPRPEKLQGCPLSKVIVGIPPTLIRLDGDLGAGICRSTQYYGSQLQASIEWQGATLQVLMEPHALPAAHVSIGFDPAQCMYFDPTSGQVIDGLGRILSKK